MSKAQASIGFKGERFLEERISSLVWTTDDPNAPDFYHEHPNFWLESKTGNIRWGPRIKKYQIDQFRDLDEPVIYAFNFHNFDDATERLYHKTETLRQKYLDRHMGIEQTYFVSNDLVGKIWDIDSKLPGNGVRGMAELR